jgi:GNAT superfamily N-acetyltransferase
MSDIVTEFSEPSIIQGMESNLQELSRLWGRIIGATFHEDAESSYFISGLLFELANVVFRANFAAGDPDSNVEKLIEHLMAHHMPLSWFIGPTTQPADLSQRLLAHGWRLDDNAPGMALDLLTLDENAPLSSKLKIEQVSDGETLEQWIRVLVAGSEFPDSVLDFVLGLYRQYGYASSPAVRCYLGQLDGEPVTTSLLFLAGGVAGIYDVATLPHARGQGFGTAITLAPLLDARRLGYRFGILQSSAMGLNVYRRLGFQTYCTISLYFWPLENKVTFVDK